MTVAVLTLADLTRILRECAGHDERMDLGEGILDLPFIDLGYDSLALLEAACRIEREFGIELSDDLVAVAGSPRVLIDMVNQPLAIAS